MTAIKKNSKYFLYAYFIYTMIIKNFTRFDINTETLDGSVEFYISILSDFRVGFLLAQVIAILIFYFCIKGNKIATGLMFFSICLDGFASLLIMQTANFSLYNIIIIINIVLAVLSLYHLIYIRKF